MEPVTPGGNPGGSIFQRHKWLVWVIAGVGGVAIILFLRNQSASSSGTTAITTPPVDSTGGGGSWGGLTTNAGATQASASTVGQGAPVQNTGIVSPSPDFITGLYQNFLQRTPENGGALYWSQQYASDVASGQSVQQAQANVTQQFAGSAQQELQGETGVTTTASNPTGTKG